MYNIANKHNKKTRKLSSSSRNKHKSSSKSKNKRKHKYTIGNTRKYTKYHNTIHIGGMLGKGQGRMAYNASQRQSVQALPEPASMSQRVRQSIQSQSQRPSAQQEVAPGVTAPQDVTRRLQVSQREPLRKRKQQNTDLEGESWPTSKKTTEKTLLNPPELHDTATINAAATTDVAAPAADANAAAQAKKDAREATKQQEKERLQTQSKDTYDKFINKINEYDFETSPGEPSYIKFSKFIQEIMDLQFSIKDDQTRKQAQTITDQILNAYSALVSFHCSNKFLKKHFEDYSKKLQLKIQIKDLKQPTVNIDPQVSSINDKLQNLANAQDCNHPLSEHLVKETPADISDSTFRFPSFSLPSLRPPSLRLPSFRSSSSTNTSRATTSPRATTSRVTPTGYIQDDTFGYSAPRSAFDDDDDEGLG
jgi:hypothetical protein